MDPLDTPLSLPCGLELDHRVALAPLTNKQSHADGTLSDDEYRWLTRRAAGGFAWVSTCAAFVSEEGKAWRGQLGISSDDHLPGLRRLAAGLREHGARSVVQLHHAGAKADQAPGQKLSTADFTATDSRAANLEDLERVKGDFVAAALRAQTAGFDGVEIHGANGYLFTQFLAPKDNPRQDAYGGALEGRARLLRETLVAVRAATRADFAVGVRISPVDVWAPRGLLLADACRLAPCLAEDGADFVHLSLADASGPAPHELDSGSVTTAIRRVLPPELPLFCAGGVWTRADALRAREAGADVVVLGRSGIAHPDWPQAAQGEGWQPRRPPWSPDHLRAADVGDALLEYLRGFPGMVAGGAPARSEG